MRINHNIQALNAYRNLTNNQGVISKHIERLSSGLRINHAADDAAGLAISEKMRTQIRGLQAAERNSMDGISLVQTAEGALDSVQAMLQRMRELAVQAANDTSTDSDRLALQDEINQLTSEINRVGNSIEFNSRKLLDGSISSSNFSNVGRIKGGSEEIMGMKAFGSLTAGTPPFTIHANALEDGTDLNGYKFVFGVDSDAPASVKTSSKILTVIDTPASFDPSEIAVGGTNGNVTFTPIGLDGDKLIGYTFVFGTDSDSGLAVSLDSGTKTITITADWDGSISGGTIAPANLNAIQIAINNVLTTEGLGNISLASSGTFAAGNFGASGQTITILSSTPAIVSKHNLTISPTPGDASLAGVTFNFVHNAGVSPATAAKSGNTITVTTNLSDPNALQDIKDKLKADFGVSFTYNGSAQDLDGQSLKIANNNVKASLAGRTITITADWDNSNNGQPKSLDELTTAINIALRAEGLGMIELSTAGGTLTTAEISQLLSAGEVSLMGGITRVDAKPSMQILSVNARPNENDILVINEKVIAFWDSSKSTYADEATAKSALNAHVMIDIYNGMRYKESYEITSEISALDFTTNPVPTNHPVTVQASEAGSDLIITSTVTGKASNNIRTDYFPTIDAGLNLQIGANTGQKLVVDIPNIRAQSLKITGITAGGEVLSADGKTKAYLTAVKTVNNGLDAELTEYAISVSSHEHASAAITIFEDALNRVSAARSGLGAYQNRLEYTVSNLAQTAENVTAAESRIRDADMALEMTNFTKSNIIAQAAQAMLSQANQLPQGILQLLK